MKLKPGDKGIFCNHTGELIKGKIIAEFNEVYFVIADDPNKLCSMFSDGLYRFRYNDLMVKSNAT